MTQTSAGHGLKRDRKQEQAIAALLECQTIKRAGSELKKLIQHDICTILAPGGLEKGIILDFPVKRNSVARVFLLNDQCDAVWKSVGSGMES